MGKTILVPLCQVVDLKEFLVEMDLAGDRTGEYECRIEGETYTFVFDCDTMTFNEFLDYIG